MVYSSTLEKRFWAKVEKGDGCWLWTGATIGRKKHRYGAIHIGRDASGSVWMGTHRVSWLLAHGPIPEGQIVCHHCDTPLCVRPDHLFLGTHRDNVHDALTKGRRPRRLSIDDVYAIREAFDRGEGSRALGERYGITRNYVWAIGRRKRFKTLPERQTSYKEVALGVQVEGRPYPLSDLAGGL